MKVNLGRCPLGVDAIHVSVGFGVPMKAPGFLPSVAPTRAPDGCIVSLAENIKKAVSIPVIAVNKIGNIDLAEEILEKGRADLIAMGRPLIADPYLPLKGMEGRRAEIIPCISCCQGCLQNVTERERPVSCSINPLAAREGEMEVLPAPRRKHVMVVGGGPGGMMAAKTLAERGHRVILCEKDLELGGQLNVASVPPGKNDVLKLKHYLTAGAQKAGVEIHVGEEVKSNSFEWTKLDAVIIISPCRLGKGCSSRKGGGGRSCLD